MRWRRGRKRPTESGSAGAGHPRSSRPFDWADRRCERGVTGDPLPGCAVRAGTGVPGDRAPRPPGPDRLRTRGPLDRGSTRQHRRDGHGARRYASGRGRIGGVGSVRSARPGGLEIGKCQSPSGQPAAGRASPVHGRLYRSGSQVRSTGSPSRAKFGSWGSSCSGRRGDGARGCPAFVQVSLRKCLTCGAGHQ